MMRNLPGGSLLTALLPYLIPVFLAVSVTWGATAGWKFAWSDEFNGPQVDAAVWGYENGYVRNSEVQYYSNRSENSRIDNGTLLIQALRDNWNGHAYTSASRTTRGKRSWQYGRFEMRARIDIRQGSWPAWWWLPDSGGWPRGGEIDMMEFYQSKCLFNVMDGNQKWYTVTKSISSLGGNAWANHFHTWTMEWDSTRIDLSLDGVLINHFPLAQADGTGPNGSNPFRHPGYMLLNQALGGTNGGDPSATTFPIDFRVDWVRVHGWTEGSAHALTVTGGSGSGVYLDGTSASITANMPPAGQSFDKWVAVSGTPVFADLLSPTTQITMPASDIAVQATYKAATSLLIRRSDSARKRGEDDARQILTVHGLDGLEVSPQVSPLGRRIPVENPLRKLR